MIRHATVGTSASSVTLDADYSRVAVLNRDGTATVFVRADGTNPTVEGDDTYAVPPGARRVIPVTASGDTVVRLISDEAGTKVEVEA